MSDYIRQAVRDATTPRASEPAPWPDEPRPPGAPEPEALPLEALPAVLRAIATTVSASVQVAPSMPAGLVLAAVSAAVADRVVVRPDDAWTREHIPLYIVVVAPPAARKSPVYAILTPPLREWEAERAREAAPHRRVAEAIVDARAKALQRAQGGDSDDEVEAAVLALQEAEEAVPTIPRLLAQDSTPEALVRQMAEQGGRVAVMSPEGGPLRILDGRYSDGVARLEELAKAYDGEEIKSGRISRSDVHVPRPIMTLGVMLQPSVLDSIRNGRSLRGQGIYGRISWIVPRTRVGTRVDSSEAPPLDRQARRRYRDMLHRLLDWEPRGHTPEGIPVPHELRLSGEAQARKREYHTTEVEPGIVPGGPLAAVEDWAGKTVGRAIRIAALLDLAARADEGRPLTEPISGWAMESGVRICRALTTHAMHVYGEMEMDRRTSDLRYLLRRLQELPEGTTETELRRAVQGRTSIVGAEDVADLVDDLETRGCVRRVARLQDGPGRPSSPTLELHPSLCTDIAEIAKTPREEGNESDSRNIRNTHAGAPPEQLPGGMDPEELTEEDRQYLRDEREGMQVEEPPVEVPGLLEVDR